MKAFESKYPFSRSEIKALNSDSLIPESKITGETGLEAKLAYMEEEEEEEETKLAQMGLGLDSIEPMKDGIWSIEMKEEKEEEVVVRGLVGVVVEEAAMMAAVGMATSELMVVLDIE